MEPEEFAQRLPHAVDAGGYRRPRQLIWNKTSSSSQCEFTQMNEYIATTVRSYPGRRIDSMFIVPSQLFHVKSRRPWTPMHWQNLCFEVLTESCQPDSSVQVEIPRGTLNVGSLAASYFPARTLVSIASMIARYISLRVATSQEEVVGYTRLLMGKPALRERMLDISEWEHLL